MCRIFFKICIAEEKRSPENEVEKVHYLNEIATWLTNSEAKGFFIFMTMLSFKQAESNYG